MPVNRNALVRYKTIDKCLQNRFRKWTLNDLIDAVSDALYEYEGIGKGVSRRTVQGDIQMMRSDKLGYNAPIVVLEKKFYTYENANYSITNIPITNQDLGKMSEAVEFLKQFKGFSHFRELDGMVQKLEDHVYSAKTNNSPVIDFEKNENLKGLKFLDELYQAIIQKKAIQITYQSFKARQSQTFDFHPFLLKEFRNRWFLIGKRQGHSPIMNLALDRMIEIEKSEIPFAGKRDFDPTIWFKDAIGVSVSQNMSAEEVLLFVNHKHAPYLLTKPLHHSQKEVSRNKFGVMISLQVQLNFELEKDILAFGEVVKVVAPERLKKTIYDRLRASVDLYDTELTEKGLESAFLKFTHKGTANLNFVYAKREVRKMGHLLGKYFLENPSDAYAKTDFWEEMPALREIIFNKNMTDILAKIDKNAVLAKAVYYEKPPTEDDYFKWKQTDQKGFLIRIHLFETNEKNGALQVFPGSHRKILKENEIELIVSNSVSQICAISEGGVHLLSPLLLRSYMPVRSMKKRKILELWFC